MARLRKELRRAWRRLKAATGRIPVVSSLVESEGLRASVVGAWSALFDLAYAAFVMTTGFRYDSGWAIAVASYHVALAGIGFALVFGIQRSRRREPGPRRTRELQMARTCGVLLLLMAAALAAVMGRMVANRQAWAYDTSATIAIAVLTAATLAFAIANVARVRRATHPAQVASRSVSLSKALVDAFFLATALLAAFAPGREIGLPLEAALGCAVFLLVVAIAASLLAFAGKARRAEGPSR